MLDPLIAPRPHRGICLVARHEKQVGGGVILQSSQRVRQKIKEDLHGLTRLFIGTMVVDSASQLGLAWGGAHFDQELSQSRAMILRAFMIVPKAVILLWE